MINAGDLSGSGLIEANGGNGYSDGGSGGGGRIAIYYTSLKGFDFDKVTAHGGNGGSGVGAVGSIYLKSASDRGLLRLDSHGTPAGSWTPLGVDGNAVFDAGQDLVSIQEPTSSPNPTAR